MKLSIVEVVVGASPSAFILLSNAISRLTGVLTFVMKLPPKSRQGRLLPLLPPFLEPHLTLFILLSLSPLLPLLPLLPPEEVDDLLLPPEEVDDLLLPLEPIDLVLPDEDVEVCLSALKCSSFWFNSISKAGDSTSRLPRNNFPFSCFLCAFDDEIKASRTIDALRNFILTSSYFFVNDLRIEDVLQWYRE